MAIGPPYSTVLFSDTGLTEATFVLDFNEEISGDTVIVQRVLFYCNTLDIGTRNATLFLQYLGFGQLGVSASSDMGGMVYDLTLFGAVLQGLNGYHPDPIRAGAAIYFNSFSSGSTPRYEDHETKLVIPVYHD